MNFFIQEQQKIEVYVFRALLNIKDVQFVHQQQNVVNVIQAIIIIAQMQYSVIQHAQQVFLFKLIKNFNYFLLLQVHIKMVQYVQNV